MKHLKRFYTEDDVSDFFDGFDESQSPGILMACDAYPGEAYIIHRPQGGSSQGGAFTCVLTYMGETHKTISVPYDPESNTVNLYNLIRENGFPERPDNGWEPYRNGARLNNWYDKQLQESGIEPGDTIEWRYIVPL